MSEGRHESEYPISQVIPKGTYRRDLGDIETWPTQATRSSVPR